MKNKVIILILLMLLNSINAFSQKKEVANALRKGKNRKGYYVAKGPFQLKDFKKWYSRNESRYVLIDYDAYQRVIYGAKKYEVDWFGFVPLSEYDNYKANKLRKARRTKSFSGGKVIAAIGVFAIGVKALQSISSSSSSSSSYSSGSSPRYKILSRSNDTEVTVKLGNTPETEDCVVHLYLSNVPNSPDYFSVVMSDNRRTDTYSSEDAIPDYEFFNPPVTVKIKYQGFWGINNTCNIAAKIKILEPGHYYIYIEKD